MSNSLSHEEWVEESVQNLRGHEDLLYYALDLLGKSKDDSKHVTDNSDTFGDSDWIGANIFSDLKDDSFSSLLCEDIQFDIIQPEQFGYYQDYIPIDVAPSQPLALQPSLLVEDSQTHFDSENTAALHLLQKGAESLPRDSLPSSSLRSVNSNVSTETVQQETAKPKRKRPAKNTGNVQGERRKRGRPRVPPQLNCYKHIQEFRKAGGFDVVTEEVLQQSTNKASKSVQECNSSMTDTLKAILQSSENERAV